MRSTSESGILSSEAVLRRFPVRLMLACAAWNVGRACTAASVDATAIVGDTAGTVSVKDAPYFATGDGDANDTRAIQDAINTAAALAAQHKGLGSIVHLPPGAYRLKSNLTCVTGTRLLVDPGAEFDLASAVTIAFEDGPSQMIVGERQRVFDINEPSAVAFLKAGTVWASWFGAKGNGATDDGLALVAMAESAAPGSTLHPFGHHRLTRQFFIHKDNITVDGIDANQTWLDFHDGTKYLPDNNDMLKRIDPYAGGGDSSTQRSCIYVSCGTSDVVYNCRFRNLTVRPPVNDATSQMQPDKYSIYSRCKTLKAEYVSGFEVDHCVFYEQAWEGLYHDWPNYNTLGAVARNLNVHDCIFYGPLVPDANALGACVNWNTGSPATRGRPDEKDSVQSTIVGCRFDGCSYGILISGMGWLVSGNLFRRTGETAVSIGEDTESAGRGVIANNVFIQTGWKYAGSCQAIGLWGGEEGVTVIGNTISDTCNGAAIRGHCPNAHLVGNTISGLLSGRREFAIMLSQQDGNQPYTVSITGNTIQDSNTPGYVKWYGGLGWQGAAGIVGCSTCCSDNVWDCNVYAISAGSSSYHAKIYLSGDRGSGLFLTRTGGAPGYLPDVVTFSDVNQPNFMNNAGTPAFQIYEPNLSGTATLCGPLRLRDADIVHDTNALPPRTSSVIRLYDSKGKPVYVPAFTNKP